MATELLILGLLALFAASLWIPYIVGVTTAPEGSIPADAPDGFHRPPDPSVQRAWVHRAYRAHLNLLELAQRLECSASLPQQPQQLLIQYTPPGQLVKQTCW